MKRIVESPQSSQSFALQLIYPDKAGMFARIAQTIGRHGGDLGQIDLLGPTAKRTTSGIRIRVRDEQHLEEIVAAVRGLDKVKVVRISYPASRNDAARQDSPPSEPHRKPWRRAEGRHQTRETTRCSLLI
jgi:hypothetical protein